MSPVLQQLREKDFGAFGLLAFPDHDGPEHRLQELGLSGGLKGFEDPYGQSLGSGAELGEHGPVTSMLSFLVWTDHLTY